MSILKPIEETVDISVNEIKELIGFDIGVKSENIILKVKVEPINDFNHFNRQSIEKVTSLLAIVSLPGRTQKFEIFESDLKKLLEKNLQQNFENNTITFNYQKEKESSDYSLINISVGKKIELKNDADDLIMQSLSSMNNFIKSMSIKTQNLEEMNQTIESLEISLEQARDKIKKNKF